MSAQAPQDVGVLLKQERERKGISLEVVHEATKVPLDALKAIEEGYKVRTLTAFYYRSFVKIYALYLGLDANFIVTLIPTHHPKPAVASVPVRPGSVRPSSRSGAGSHRVEGVRSWNLLSHPIILKKKKKVFKVVVVLAAVIIGIVALGFVVRKIAAAVAVHHALDAASRPAPKAPARKARVAVSVKSARAEVSRPSGEENALENAGDEAAEKPVMAVEKKRVSVTVRAQSSTWVNVNVDGVNAYRGNFKKGTSETWRGVKKIELSSKDIGALEFEVNGRNIGKLSRRDLKAKKVIVTPAGLNVE